MNKRYGMGKRGEDMAMAYFKRNKFQVLERNFRFGRAEIDLIVRKDQLMVFAEVKTRSSLHFGFPETMISDGQIERILTAAEAYLLQKDWRGMVRFDIISVVIQGPNTQLCHFRDAFY
ncbi:YraN family protein [Fulvivirga sedimenti]|uniref:UPF0102 protein LDX50_26580 n=1 Tax=Fulvivirga sedimenti TaxID=2879465 RepID=A0A9X1KZ19_9BACT|nr:YraN family protein [Fulvivirga sedimenti]MCA6078468.1 YraN family protein [Fulvivirga sedimenti]